LLRVKLDAAEVARPDHVRAAGDSSLETAVKLTVESQLAYVHETVKNKL